MLLSEQKVTRQPGEQLVLWKPTAHSKVSLDQSHGLRAPYMCMSLWAAPDTRTTVSAYAEKSDFDQSAIDRKRGSFRSVVSPRLTGVPPLIGQ